MSLEKETRDAIGRTVRSLRSLFEDEFGKHASGRFGIRSTPRGHAGGEDALEPWLDPVESLSLTPAEFAQRDELVHALRYLTSEAHEPSQAVARLIREAAFTAVNRILTVRVAEAIGFLPPVLSAGRQSSGYRDTVGDLFPGLAHDEDSYWMYLQIAGDELAPGVPRLFDRRHPTSAFVPSRACVDDVLELLSAAELDGAWAEPETLGWGYQFFNGDDVKDMRNASPAAPRNSRELAVRNQFFTPRYVVDWLVQNTLGRRLAQAGYDLDLPLLVGAVGDHEPLALEDVRVLDPAVGSGHFLLSSYDLLEQAWQSTGVPPEQAAAKILPCLFGVDIDPRAAQVAQAVLLLRARRSAPSTELSPPTIVTAVALPHSKQLREQAFGNLSPAARHLADEITDALDQAPLLGSLLKVEQRLQTELASHRTEPRLAVDGTEAYILDELHRTLDELVSAAASPEQRMFTADATDALRFIEICQQRYDAVLMNPPFGDPIADTKDYLKAAYGSAATDLYAAFVSRGVELLRDSGHVGAITSRTGFFIHSFEDWRVELLLPRLRAVLDLGIGVMHDAMVQAAAYVIADSPPSGEIEFRRVMGAGELATAVRNGLGATFTRHRESFNGIPERPVAYWLSERLLSVFRTATPMDSGGRSIRVGLQTSNDFRFVRLYWEVPLAETGRGRRWVTFAKGGAFSPFHADLHLVVDWEDEGRRLREAAAERAESESRTIRSEDHYFRPGITWPRRSQKGFFAAAVPASAIFSDNGQMLFTPADDPEELLSLLAYLNSTLASALLEAMVPFGQYHVGAVQRLPFPELPGQIGTNTKSVLSAAMKLAAQSETHHLFMHPWVRPDVAPEHIGLAAQALDQQVTSSVGLHAQPLSATVSSDWLREEFTPPVRTGAAELSYCVGVAFGRWDLRFAEGSIEPPPAPGPFDPLPVAVRGRLVESDGLPVSRAPNGYALDLPPGGLLHDDPGHGYDIVTAIERVIGRLELCPEVPELRLSDVGSLREYLRGKFFAAHLKQYSASRRYAPIYWQLAVPSKRWGLWLYAPSLSRESLFAIARAAREKLSSLNDQIGLAHERADADRDARERAEGLEELAAEIEKFAAIAQEAAQSGWEPDLNDGFVLNAAPLEELFVDKKWRGQIAKHRKAMQKGNYPWATVQREYFKKGA